jgi:dTMP kinase
MYFVFARRIHRTLTFADSQICLIIFVLFVRYGGERYEKRDIQQRVRKQFAKLQEQEKEEESNNNHTKIPWTIINADESIDLVSNNIWDIVQPTIQSCMYQPISKMWQEGYWEL